jgi:hypothetical protein
MQYDMKPYLTRFFMGPFLDRTTALATAASKHGERSMVVGIHDGRWWVNPWREENFHPERWVEGFELVDRRSAAIARLKNRPSIRMTLDNDRIDTIRSLFGRRGREAVTEDFDFDFANWLADEDFNVKLPEKPEDVRMAANLAGADDDIFYKILSQHPICPAPGQIIGDRRK